jgi:hypothetical protein
MHFLWCARNVYLAIIFSLYISCFPLKKKNLGFFFFFFFVVLGFKLGLHLEPVLFCDGYFQDRVSYICPDWPRTVILHISAS